ncbi:NYN domain-containing protein [Lysobacter sp. TY2-98]|uniref:NYN domain-containing protein n=1 Tax=Lysobacter sp. TY2-98 TaxID=2290922 RepID=UPI000E1FBD1D|nr:NYN domain-containing protein [Lysobacter sp. TY2-98]AXK72681.1 NYN domain-containing protein [Lysobacter sp. TY2-98]
MTSRNGSKTIDTRRLAILIDADNAQPSVIGGLLDEVAKYGTASVRRIYGDFTSTQQSGWKKVLLQHSIQPMQQFAYTSGKNATDSTLIIDAMDLMYTGRFDGFCLVSSDSDFTRLAQRLREEGLTVYGFGERKTPDAFVQACDKFVYTEVLRAEPVPTPVAKKSASKGVAKKATPTPQVQPAKAQAAGVTPASTPTSVPVDLIRQAIDQASDESGWANLGAVGNYLNKVRPDFDPRLYGKKKLSDLLKMHPAAFRLEERAAPDGQGKVVFVALAG